MATLEELEARVRVLEDERELRALLSQYAFTADLGRSREWADLWTEDGVFDLGRGRGQTFVGEPAEPGRYVGREELLWKLITGRGHKVVEGRSQHHTIGPLVFHIDGDDATAEGYSLVIVRHPSRTREAMPGWEPDLEFNIINANFNHWRFRRVDGRWRVSERTNRQLGSAEATELIFGSKDAP